MTWNPRIIVIIVVPDPNPEEASPLKAALKALKGQTSPQCRMGEHCRGTIAKMAPMALIFGAVSRCFYFVRPCGVARTPHAGGTDRRVLNIW